MLRICVYLLFAICAFSLESLAVVYVSPSHPYYPLMKQYLLDDENKDIKTEDISNDDKLEDCIRKVFIIRRKLINHPVKDNPLAYRKFFTDVYARIVHDAYVKYPNDALLNALYADVVLDCSGRYKYNNEDNRDKNVYFIK